MHHDGREDNKVTTAVGPRRENLCNDVFGSLVISLGLSVLDNLTFAFTFSEDFQSQQGIRKEKIFSPYDS